MAYDHVAMIPFLIDDSHLSPEEVVERNANPTRWAAKRYGQPEHIFQAAAECHKRQSSNREQAASLPNARRSMPQTSGPAPIQSRQNSSQQATLVQPRYTTPVVETPGGHAVTSSSTSSPSGSYFSTVLSSPTLPDGREVESPSPIKRTHHLCPDRATAEVNVQRGSMSSKKKGKMPV